MRVCSGVLPDAVLPEPQQQRRNHRDHGEGVQREHARRQQGMTHIGPGYGADPVDSSWRITRENGEAEARSRSAPGRRAAAQQPVHTRRAGLGPAAEPGDVGLPHLREPAAHLRATSSWRGEARDAHDGMLDQETGLRAWLATGDPQFLGPYRSGKAHTETAVRRLIKEVRTTPDLDDGVDRMLLRRQRWQAWAADSRHPHLQRQAEDRRDAYAIPAQRQAAVRQVSTRGDKQHQRDRRTPQRGDLAPDHGPRARPPQLPAAARRHGCSHPAATTPPADDGPRTHREPAATRSGSCDQATCPRVPRRPRSRSSMRSARLSADSRRISPTPSSRPRAGNVASPSWPTGSRRWSASGARSRAA